MQRPKLSEPAPADETSEPTDAEPAEEEPSAEEQLKEDVKNKLKGLF